MIFHDDASQTEPSYWPDEILVTQITAIISNDRALLTPRIIYLAEESDHPRVSVSSLCESNKEIRFYSNQDMDFEKEMKESLKVIFQNIKALEDSRDKTPTSLKEPVMRFKGRQRNFESPAQRHLAQTEAGGVRQGN